MIAFNSVYKDCADTLGQEIADRLFAESDSATPAELYSKFFNAYRKELNEALRKIQGTNGQVDTGATRSSDGVSSETISNRLDEEAAILKDYTAEEVNARTDGVKWTPSSRQ